MCLQVLQVSPRYFPNIGGVETIVQKISEKLAENGVRVAVYSVDLDHGMKKQEEINGVLVTRFNPLIRDPFFIPEPRFVSALQQEQADIIHVHNIHVFPPFLVGLFKRREQRLLLQPHYHRYGQSPIRNSLLKLYRYVLNKLVFPRIDLVVVNSFYEKRIICEDFPGSRNVVLIPEGMDVDEIKAVKRSLVEPKRILYVGGLRRYKNVDKIIEGFALQIRKTGENLKLVIVGDGREYPFLAGLARNLGVEDFIEWKRNLSRQQLLQEYAKASVFVLLSQLESFSRVVYDALLMSVPVVVLNHGATEYLVKAGFAEGVNSLGPEEIADALLKAATKTYPKISDGPDTFLKWEEYSDKLDDIYHKLIEGTDVNLAHA